MRIVSKYHFAVLLVLLSTSPMFAKPRQKFSFSWSPVGRTSIHENMVKQRPKDSSTKIVDDLSTKTAFGINSDTMFRIASHFDLGVMARMHTNLKPDIVAKVEENGIKLSQVEKRNLKLPEDLLTATIVDLAVLPKTYVKLTPALELNASCGLGLSVLRLSTIDKLTEYMGGKLDTRQTAFVMVPGVGMEYSFDANNPEAVALSLDARYSMANYGEGLIGKYNLFTVAAGIVYSL